MENYPELKADANFRELQKELSDTEGKIAFAQFYNDTVQKYNIRLRFSANIVAQLLVYAGRLFPWTRTQCKGRMCRSGLAVIPDSKGDA